MIIPFPSRFAVPRSLLVPMMPLAEVVLFILSTGTQTRSRAICEMSEKRLVPTSTRTYRPLQGFESKIKRLLKPPQGKKSKAGRWDRREANEDRSSFSCIYHFTFIFCFVLVLFRLFGLPGSSFEHCTLSLVCSMLCVSFSPSSNFLEAVVWSRLICITIIVIVIIISISS